MSDNEKLMDYVKRMMAGASEKEMRLVCIAVREILRK